MNESNPDAIAFRKKVEAELFPSGRYPVPVPKSCHNCFNWNGRLLACRIPERDDMLDDLDRHYRAMAEQCPDYDNSVYVEADEDEEYPPTSVLAIAEMMARQKNKE